MLISAPGAVSGNRAEVAAKELEGAVDVSQVDPEQHPHRNIEHLGKHSPVQRIAPLHAKTGDDVVLAREGHQQAQIADVELAIRIHEHDEVAGRSSNPDVSAAP